MKARATTAVLALTAFAAGTLVGCTGNGPWIDRADLTGETTTEKRPVDGFTSIAFGGNATLTVIQGDAFLVEVTADSGLQERIGTSVNGSTLEIDQNYSMLGSTPEVKVTVTLPSLTKVAVAGATTTSVTGVTSESLTIVSAGASDITLEGDVHTLTVDVAGSGDVTLHGTGDATHISVTGAGNIHGSDLTAQTAQVSVVGAGDVELRVKDSLDVDVAGSGDITYYGDPAVSTDISGSGEIRRADS